MATSRRRILVVLTVFAAVFASLEIRSYSTTSATWDEPVHLTAGYLALTRGDYRLDPTHPPLVRLWAALPLMAIPVKAPDTSSIDHATPNRWLSESYKSADAFLYRRNDGDRLLYAARFMVVLLGIALGVLLFAWVNEWLGFRPAILALAFYTLEPNLLAHASVVTTDFGVTLFIFAACYFLWRVCRAPASRSSIAGLTLCAALAVVAKWSGLLLAAVVVPMLLLATIRRMLSAGRALAIAALLCVMSIATIWAVYGFRYAPSATDDGLFRAQELPAVQKNAPGFAALLAWIDDQRLLPNAYTQGLLYGEASAEDLPAYLDGNYSRTGWWYYFPVALTLKMPLALIMLLAVGLATLARRRTDWPTAGFVVIPPVVFLGFAMASGINIGVRHILPVFPFAIMIAAAGASTLIAARNRLVHAALAILAAVWLVNLARVYPNTLTFFSIIVGGPEHGRRYLTDSNIDWGQQLKDLSAWMKARGVNHINLAYFGTADPGYYGIDCTLLPGSPRHAETSQRPQLPGYVAIGATVLSGVYASPAARLLYSGFKDLEPVADVGHSIRVYWVDRWPESPPQHRRDEGWQAELALADSLLFDQGWYDHAILHYRRYLSHRPADGNATGNLGLALLQSGPADEALTVLRRATALTPTSATLHRLLAAALCEHGDPGEAETHARRAVALAPTDPVARDILGRALALQERWGEAANAFSGALAIAPGFSEAREHLSWIEGAGDMRYHERPGQIRSR